MTLLKDEQGHEHGKAEDTEYIAAPRAAAAHVQEQSLAASSRDENGRVTQSDGAA